MVYDDCDVIRGAQHGIQGVAQAGLFVDDRRCRCSQVAQPAFILIIEVLSVEPPSRPAFCIQYQDRILAGLTEHAMNLIPGCVLLYNRPLE